MKTIEEKAKEYAKPYRGFDFSEAPALDVEKAFIAGVEFGQRWINDELPKDKKLCLVKIQTGIHENIEVAFYTKKTNTWSVIANCYKSSNVTHWRPIELK